MGDDAALAQMRRKWGSRFAKNLEVAQRALEDVGGDEIAELLDDTGLGNDPRVIRMFARIGRQTR